MKTLTEILAEKVKTRRNKVMTLFGQTMQLRDDKRIRERLANDPALAWLANAVGDEVSRYAIEHLYQPQSPFKATEQMQIAFAEAIMLWEEVNNEYNAQLRTAPAENENKSDDHTS